MIFINEIILSIREFTFNNFNKQTRLSEPTINKDKNYINNRLNTREYIPNTGSLNIHGKNLPIIDRFPKNSRDMVNQ